MLKTLLTFGYRAAQNRPARVVHRNALNKGFFGESRFWWWVAAFFAGRATIKSVFGKHPERISTEVLRPGQIVRVDALRLTRRQRAALRRAR